MNISCGYLCSDILHDLLSDKTIHFCAILWRGEAFVDLCVPSLAGLIQNQKEVTFFRVTATVLHSIIDFEKLVKLRGYYSLSISYRS